MTAESDAARTGDRVLLLTPTGVGAISVVRIVGKGVENFLQLHFTAAPRIGRATHGNLFDAEQVIDDPLVALLSPTIADINLHGGPWLVQRVIDLAAREGFTYLEDEIPLPVPAVDGADALETEMLIALPQARTEEGVRLLLAQPEAWKRLLAAPLDKHASRQMLYDRSLHWMLNPPTVAIVGPPNVGKSSLANQLFGRARSITADLPGTTRDWVGDVANIDGLPVMLLDTPGVRETADVIETEAIERARAEIDRADFVVLVDEAGGAAAGDVLRYRSAVKVTNKLDRGRGIGININAITGDGIDQLRRAIRIRFDWEPMDLTKACCWTERQRKVLKDLFL